MQHISTERRTNPKEYRTQRVEVEIAGRRRGGWAGKEVGEALGVEDAGLLRLRRDAAYGHIVHRMLAKQADGRELGNNSLLPEAGRPAIRPRRLEECQDRVPQKGQSLRSLFSSSSERWHFRSHCILSFNTILKGTVFAIFLMALGAPVTATGAFAGTSEEDTRKHQNTTDTEALRDIIQKTPWAFAARVGDLKARAELCRVPSDRYETVIRDARALLPGEYRKIGRDPDDIEQDIARGRDFILEMHKTDPNWPPGLPSCLGFMSSVADLQCWILIAQGKSKKDCPPLPPPEPLGWQDRP